MKAKEIIKLNNAKREKLKEGNLKDYEDMLTYIRLTSAKSEQQTEEILLELLDHALIAQEEGKTVREVFGDDLKAYSQDVIEEIPGEVKKKQFKFTIRLILLFLGISSLFIGIINTGLHFIWGFGENAQTFHIGSSIAIIVIDTLIVFGMIYFVLKWLKDSIFGEKKKSAKVEFLQLWAMMTLVTGVFFCVIYFMPTFGTEFSLPIVTFIPLGLVLYGISHLLKT